MALVQQPDPNQPKPEGAQMLAMRGEQLGVVTNWPPSLEAALQRWGTISPKAPCLTTMDTNGKPLYILTYGNSRSPFACGSCRHTAATCCGWLIFVLPSVSRAEVSGFWKEVLGKLLGLSMKSNYLLNVFWVKFRNGYRKLVIITLVRCWISPLGMCVWYSWN